MKIDVSYLQTEPAICSSVRQHDTHTTIETLVRDVCLVKGLSPDHVKRLERQIEWITSNGMYPRAVSSKHFKINKNAMKLQGD